LTANLRFLESLQTVHEVGEDVADSWAANSNPQNSAHDIASNLQNCQSKILDIAQGLVNGFDRGSSNFSIPCVGSGFATAIEDKTEKLRHILEIGREVSVKKMTSIIMGPHDELAAFDSNEAHSLQISDGSEMKNTWAQVAITQRRAVKRLTKLLPRE